jgi:hypothetical protein
LGIRRIPVRISVRHLAFGVAFLLACGGILIALAASSLAGRAPGCGRGNPSDAIVGAPTARLAWRAGLLAPTAVYRGLPRAGAPRIGAVAPRHAPWLLVLRAAHDRDGHCWLKVRLPTRPNRAAGWLDARQVTLRATPWRIVISRARRTLTTYRDGALARRARIVVGAAATPTPRGLFSIIGSWRSQPGSFLGSWILPLTAHSDVLQEFGGGDGRIGIHGRGGASLSDPLGSAASHGCIRLANRAIEWLVRAVGRNGLAGIPVQVR